MQFKNLHDKNTPERLWPPQLLQDPAGEMTSHIFIVKNQSKHFCHRFFSYQKLFSIAFSFRVNFEINIWSSTNGFRLVDIFL